MNGDPIDRTSNEWSRNSCEYDPSGAAYEIERLNGELEIARRAMVTVDRLLAEAGYAEDSSARNLLLCGRPSLADNSPCAHETTAPWSPQLGEYVRVTRFEKYGKSLGWKIRSMSLEDEELWFDLRRDTGTTTRCTLGEIERLADGLPVKASAKPTGNEHRARVDCDGTNCKGHPFNCYGHPHNCGCTQNGE